MLHWIPDLPDLSREADSPSQMMTPVERPFWAALRRWLQDREDPIGWACLASGGGLLTYMALGILFAWWGGRL